MALFDGATVGLMLIIKLRPLSNMNSNTVSLAAFLFALDLLRSLLFLEGLEANA